MGVTRRQFLGSVGKAGVAGVAAGSLTGSADGAEAAISEDWLGVLVDLPQCIGCRKCEYACREAAGFEVPPIETFEDTSVFAEARRPQPHEYTVVNRYDNPRRPDAPVHVKVNCFHCNDPACVSACLVGAFKKEADGSVTYDAWKCMGCRYCMVACPFQIPTYEYDNALTPQVRKCTLCAGQRDRHGGVPACVKICPNDALTFGKRSELLGLAREKIAARPDLYVDHIYGEHEVGGTSWLYLSSVPFEQLGFLTLPDQAPPKLTEAIQHGVFKFFLPPLALYGLLGVVMWLARQDGAEGPKAAPLTATGQEAAQGDGRRARDEVRRGAPQPARDETPETVPEEVTS